MEAPETAFPYQGSKSKAVWYLGHMTEVIGTLHDLYEVKEELTFNR